MKAKMNSGISGKCRAVLLCSLLWLAGCSSPGGSKPSESFFDQSVASTRSSEAVGVRQDELMPGQAAADEQTVTSQLFPGSGVFINEEAASRKPREVKINGKVTLNFEGQSLQEVVKVVLGDIMQESYVIAPGVGGKVTFATSKPVTGEQLMPILEMLLAWNNAAMIYQDGRYTVLPINQAIPGHLTPRIGPIQQVRGYEVRAIPLKYLAPTEMEKLLKPYARANAVISADNARSLLILAGSREELNNYMQTIETFDVDWLSGMSVGIFTLERVEAEKVVPELEQVFGEGANTPLAGMFRFMPLDRLNAILVITPQPDYLEQAGKWIERLDRGGSEAGSRLYVYSVQNVKAVDLADTLSQVFGGGASGSRRSSSSQGSVAPGLRAARISSNKNTAKTESGEAATSSASSGGAVNLAGDSDIRITAVEENNALLIKASPQEYEAVLAAIKRLDTVPLQVQIEAQIVEVSLEGELQHGVQWYFENAIAGASKGIFDVDTQEGLAGFPGPDRSGSTAFYSWTGPSARAVVSALESTGKTRVISAPSLTVLNNTAANLNVGDQIPVNTTTFNPNSAASNTISNVQYLQTGITLDVTPRVNPGGLVFMEISQEVSVPKDQADVNGNRSITQRSISTEVAVQSGEIVVLAGLIDYTEGELKAGVPGLHRIPVIGGLFGKQRKTSNRRELIIFIKPVVIRSPEEARVMTEEYKKRFKGLQPLTIEN